MDHPHRAQGALLIARSRGAATASRCGRAVAVSGWWPAGRVLALLLSLALAPAAPAQSAFTVGDIRLEGLQRIAPGTVFNYLPVKVGDTVDSARTAEAIRALFKTGFFKDVRIEREGDTLVVALAERPSIASIEFSGNSTLKTEDLMKALEQVGFVEGRVFNRTVFEQVEQELRRSYFNEGRYAVRIKSTVTPLERNRVGVNFDVSEGRIARIKQINIVGNEVFDDGDLLDLFQLSPRSGFSFFSHDDQYSRQALNADLETLRSHYLDRGFINFNIDSTQVSITPDKRDIYITVNISEGDQYTVREVKLAGDLSVPKEELFELVTIRQGEVFSREVVTETSEALARRLGNDGYAFANINAVPEPDEATKEVVLTLFVDPGKRVYVRRVDFTGNTRTRDEVLRREMRQLEGGWASTGAIERSRERLERLGYFDAVNVETPAVPGTTDQVDVEFAVQEKPSGNLLLGAGFSQDQGIIVNTSVTQENFLGTGNRLSAVFNNSQVNRNFTFNWLNPYFTVDGVSRGLDAHYRKTDAADANLADYDLDQLGGGVTFGVPISEFNRVDLGLSVEHTDFKLGDSPSAEVRAFDTLTGGKYNTAALSAGWASDSRDSRTLPSRGALSRIEGELALPGLDLEYYKVSLRHQRFFALPKDLVFKLDGEVGVGGGYGGTQDLPLTQNFFAGGIKSVRGFKGNTLGPRDSNGEPLGGSFKVVGSAELILPLPFIKDRRRFRLTTFMDAGNVYAPGDSFDLGKLRYSAGVAGLWLSPLGPISVSFAQPFGDEPEDDIQQFQFTLGTTF